MITFMLTDEKDNNYVFTANDDADGILGNISFTITGYDMKIDRIDAADELTAEGLVRSALNFACGKNAYMVSYSGKDFLQLLRDIGFEGRDTLSSDIPGVLMNSRCKRG